MLSPSAPRGRLLVIDGTPHAAHLVHLLQQDGFDCVQGRGPIRVRALLEEHPIDLIVWREEPGNSELIRDILDECARFPEVPIIHLFDRVTSPASTLKHPQIRESLPADSESARILSLLNRFFERPEAPASAPSHPRTELAFRNVVSNVLQHRNDAEIEEMGRGGELHAPLTSVSSAERESLASTLRVSSNEDHDSWWKRMVRRVRGES